VAGVYHGGDGRRRIGGGRVGGGGSRAEEVETC
jgi:hypothetical protein